MKKYILLVLLGSSLQTATAQSSHLQLYGFPIVFTYTERNLKLELINTQSKIKLTDIEVNEPFKWVSGCKGAELAPKAKCEFEVGLNGSEYPESINLIVRTERGDFKFNSTLQRIDKPVDQWNNDQESETHRQGQDPGTIHFPSTKIGVQGEKTKVHLKSQHFNNLVIKKISAPSFYKVEGCEGKTIESFLTAKDEKKIHCSFEINYNPKTNSDINGEMVVTLADSAKEYHLNIKLKSSPWSPMRAKKVLASEYDTYVLLHDDSLWMQGLYGWKLVKSGVSDFYLGPNKGLVVRSGNKFLARFDNSPRYGKLGEAKDASNPPEWFELIKNAKDISLAEQSIYYWDEAGNIFELGKNVMLYEDQQKRKLPYSYDKWTKMDKRFKSMSHEEDGIFGIDEKNDLWFRGSFTDIMPDGVFESKNSKGWEKIDSQIAQFEICGSSLIKLTTNGELYAKGSNYSGRVGLSKSGIIPIWSLANKDVKEFKIDCNTGSSTHEFTKIFIIKKDGTLWGHGLNRHGQLGIKPDDKCEPESKKRKFA